MLDIDFGIDYDDDIDVGLSTLLNVATAHADVLPDPAPQVFVQQLGDSSVDLRLRVWTMASNYWPVRRALTKAGKEAIEAAGLSIPFPHRTIVAKGAAAALAGTSDPASG